MKKNKKLLVFFVITALAVCSILFCTNYIVLNGQITSKSATEVVLHGDKLPEIHKLQKLEQLEVLDLRNMRIQPSDYDALESMLPDCKILWMVPFQDDHIDNMVSQLDVEAFQESDIATLRYFPELETVDGRSCSNYDVLLKLQAAQPDLTIMYEIKLGSGQSLRENGTVCTVTNDNIRLLLDMIPYLPELRTVNSENCTDYEALMELQQKWPELDVNYTVIIGDSSYDAKSTRLILKISDAKDTLEKLQFFPNLTEVVFSDPATDLELMYQLKCRYPDVVIQWDFDLCGVRTSSTATELILNNIRMESVETVENALRYFYDLQWVEMCQCGIPSEDMDALWKRHPEIRFVWAIPMGYSFVRTDVKAFIPFIYGYDINRPFYDKQAKELKYLVDLECLDIGHMKMKDISFLQYMPKLRYLIVADTEADDYSYIGKLENLIYLEMFITTVTDISFLLNLKNLEDLNIGKTRLRNPEVLTEMQWLKRLWATTIGLNIEDSLKLVGQMPNTLVVVDASHPTDRGWRQHLNYFAMRDMLGMHYMR